MKEEEIRQSAGDLVHELNNLFTSVVLRIQVEVAKIERGICDAEAIARQMRNLLKSIEDGQKLLRGFRFLLRPSEPHHETGPGAAGDQPSRGDPAGRPYLESVPFEERFPAGPVDINHLIRETLEMTLPSREELSSIGAPPVEVITNLKELPATRCDPSALKEVLINLIKNAREAMPGGGWLIFNSWAENDEIFVTLSDLGRGIPGQVRERVFEPYFTMKGTMGSGLGLSISRRIIAQHRGNLQVLSEENVGTTFILRIPVKQ